MRYIAPKKAAQRELCGRSEMRSEGGTELKTNLEREWLANRTANPFSHPVTKAEYAWIEGWGMALRWRYRGNLHGGMQTARYKFRRVELLTTNEDILCKWLHRLLACCRSKHISPSFS